jgi:hypothetical protein
MLLRHYNNSTKTVIILLESLSPGIMTRKQLHLMDLNDYKYEVLKTVTGPQNLALWNPSCPVLKVSFLLEALLKGKPAGQLPQPQGALKHQWNMKFRVFWDVLPCSRVDADRRFRGAYCLHHHRPDDSYNRALWQSYQQRHLEQVGGTDEGVRISRIQYLWYVNGSFTCRKILRHGTSGFTSHQKEGVLRIFIALKNSWPRPGLSPRHLGPVASTLTTTPPRRLVIRLTANSTGIRKVSLTCSLFFLLPTVHIYYSEYELK